MFRKRIELFPISKPILFLVGDNTNKGKSGIKLNNMRTTRASSQHSRTRERYKSEDKKVKLITKV